MIDTARASALISAWRLVPVTIGLIGVAVAGALLPSLLALPSLASQSVGTPRTLVVAWLVALIAMHSAFEPDWGLYATAGVRPRIVNLCRILLIASAGGILCAATSKQADMSAGATATMLGLGLLGGALLGHGSSWLLPTVYLLVLVGAGSVDVLGNTRWWAVPTREQANGASIVAATALVVLGSALWWRSAGHQTSLHHRA